MSVAHLLVYGASVALSPALLYQANSYNSRPPGDF